MKIIQPIKIEKITNSPLCKTTSENINIIPKSGSDYNTEKIKSGKIGNTSNLTMSIDRTPKDEIVKIVQASLISASKILNMKFENKITENLNTPKGNNSTLTSNSKQINSSNQTIKKNDFLIKKKEFKLEFEENINSLYLLNLNNTVENFTTEKKVKSNNLNAPATKKVVVGNINTVNNNYNTTSKLIAKKPIAIKKEIKINQNMNKTVNNNSKTSNISVITQKKAIGSVCTPTHVNKVSLTKQNINTNTNLNKSIKPAKETLILGSTKEQKTNSPLYISRHSSSSFNKEKVETISSNYANKCKLLKNGNFTTESNSNNTLNSSSTFANDFITTCNNNFIKNAKSQIKTNFLKNSYPGNDTSKLGESAVLKTEIKSEEGSQPYIKSKSMKMMNQNCTSIKKKVSSPFIVPTVKTKLYANKTQETKTKLSVLKDDNLSIESISDNESTLNGPDSTISENPATSFRIRKLSEARNLKIKIRSESEDKAATHFSYLNDGDIGKHNYDTVISPINPMTKINEEISNIYKSLNSMTCFNTKFRNLENDEFERNREQHVKSVEVDLNQSTNKLEVSCEKKPKEGEKLINKLRSKLRLRVESKN